MPNPARPGIKSYTSIQAAAAASSSRQTRLRRSPGSAPLWPSRSRSRIFVSVPITAGGDGRQVGRYAPGGSGRRHAVARIVTVRRAHECPGTGRADCAECRPGDGHTAAGTVFYDGMHGAVHHLHHIAAAGLVGPKMIWTRLYDPHRTPSYWTGIQRRRRYDEINLIQPGVLGRQSREKGLGRLHIRSAGVGLCRERIHAIVEVQARKPERWEPRS